MIGQRKHILTMWGDLCRKHRILKIEHFVCADASPKSPRILLKTLSQHYRNIIATLSEHKRDLIEPRKRAFAEKKPAFREKTNLNNSTFSNQSTNPRPTTTLPITSGKMDFMQQ